VLMACHYVSELWPPTGLFFIPGMIYGYGEPRWNDIYTKSCKYFLVPHTRYRHRPSYTIDFITLIIVLFDE
jgi:hypothetical protein